MTRIHGILLGFAALAVATAAPASAADPAWADPRVLDAAKKEGSLVIYSSINE
jgi:hypothetical protein